MSAMRPSSLTVALSNLAVYLTMILFAPLLHGAEANALRVGVAKLDVTPKDLTGIVGVSNRPFKGVREPIFVRALIMDDGTTTAAMVGIDFAEYGNTRPLRDRIALELKIPAEHIMIAASHDHSAPRGGPPTPGTSSMQGRPSSSAAYSKQAEDTIVDALRIAKASMQPARIGIGRGEVDVNTYRYALTQGRWRAGFNPDGPSDKTVWVLKFENLKGEPIALMMNYAVHSNVMTGAGTKENEDMIWGDISGTAERYVEKHFQDKVVALWTMGAAADQYAKFNKEFDKSWADTPATELVDIQGRMIGMEVLQTAARIAETTAVAHIKAAERVVACEMKPQVSAPANPAGQPQPQPQPQPAALQPGEKLDIHLGLIQINGTAITSVSGEVSTNIYARLKKESPYNNTIMATLVNDRAGYIPDEANWERMGAAFVRGCAENAIVNNLVEMMKGNIP
jgi:neutral ceramidase